MREGEIVCLVYLSGLLVLGDDLEGEECRLIRDGVALDLPIELINESTNEVGNRTNQEKKRDGSEKGSGGGGRRKWSWRWKWTWRRRWKWREMMKWRRW